MSGLFDDPVLRASSADIQTLGVRISPHRAPGARGYAPRGGLSNAQMAEYEALHAKIESLQNEVKLLHQSIEGMGDSR